MARPAPPSLPTVAPALPPTFGIPDAAEDGGRGDRMRPCGGCGRMAAAGGMAAMGGMAAVGGMVRLGLVRVREAVTAGPPGALDIESRGCI